MNSSKKTKGTIPKVDILLPYWGDFNLLKSAVESVLRQTENNWRLMIFDDAYPSDETRKYFNSIKDKRITYYRHKKNIGITANFNFALNAASAKHCVMMGCDDILLPRYIETALSSIGDADFYQPQVEVIDESGNTYLPLADRIKNLLTPKKNGIHSGQKLAASLCMGNWLYFPSVMWKTDLIKKYGFNSSHHDTQDMILAISIIKDGARLFLDDEVTFQYRRSAASWSSRRKTAAGGRFRDEKDVYAMLSREFRQMKWYGASLSAKIHLTSRLHQALTFLRGM